MAGFGREQCNSARAIRRAGQGELVRWDTPICAYAGDTDTLVIDASLTPVKDGRGKIAFIAFEGRDITEKKAHEREIIRLRDELATLEMLRTQFFANINHESAERGRAEELSPAGAGRR